MVWPSLRVPGSIPAQDNVEIFYIVSTLGVCGTDVISDFQDTSALYPTFGEVYHCTIGPFITQVINIEMIQTNNPILFIRNDCPEPEGRREYQKYLLEVGGGERDVKIVIINIVL